MASDSWGDFDYRWWSPSGYGPKKTWLDHITLNTNHYKYVNYVNYNRNCVTVFGCIRGRFVFC